MRLILTLLPLILSGCAETTVTPVSKSEFILSTSAESSCGSVGAAKVASKMAAVETIRAGYDRFVITGANASNNVSVVNTMPTGAFTTSSVTGYGNTAYGTSNTTFTGGGLMVLGSYDQNLLVRMFKKGESGYSNAVDARSFLGAEWADVVEKGVNFCT